jgi:N-hydroxyarylamine O-acetyltransferase
MPDARAPRAADEWATGQMDLAAYLQRIGHAGQPAPTAHTLAALHRAHVAAIPFENADIILGRGIAVDLPSIQGKLVQHGRGGYCFEHGLLLAAALETLGYHVDRLLARVGGDHDARTHLVLRVRADGQCWLADTGFGTGLIEPLPFGDDAPHAQYGWTYRLMAGSQRTWQLQEQHEGGWFTRQRTWHLQEQHEGGWATRYRFDDQPQYPADILVANHFTATYPGSAFVRQLVVIRKDPTGLRRLTGRRLTITGPDSPGTDRHLDDAEFAEVLAQTFGLQLSAEESARLTMITKNQQ